MNRRSFMLKGSAGFASFIAISPLEGIASTQVAREATRPQGAAVRPTWLKRFDDQPLSIVLRRRKFRLLINECFSGLTAPFWFNLSIHSAISAYMSKPGSVVVDHNRYFIAKGCMAHYGRNRAMLWVDTHHDGTQPAPPLAVLSVITVAKSGRYLWVIANAPLLGGTPTQLPPNFRINLARWVRSRRPMLWEGGLLQYFNVHAASPAKQAPIPSAFGLRPYRCEPSLLVSGSAE